LSGDPRARDQQRRAPAGRVALPLLGDVEREALHDHHDVMASVRPESRALAARTWVACLGLGDELRMRFACELSSALGAQLRYALLTQFASASMASAFQKSGAEPLRCLQPAQEASAIQEQLRALPEHALVIVVESVLASHLRGVLDVWIGPPPTIERGVGLAPLHAAADVRVPAPADDVARALGRALAKPLAQRLATR
jgi:hypothetical protein